MRGILLSHRPGELASLYQKLLHFFRPVVAASVHDSHMKLTLRPEWRLWPINTFLGVLDLKTGVTITLLFAVRPPRWS